ncbi:MAG: DUF3109 family protein [Bacteroidales bacterium]|nr:DUF3109 family protein [Bacteroidales bacterium]
MPTLIAVANTLIDKDIFEKYFCCPLDCCCGACCVEGDAGAPLTEEEISVIEDNMEFILPYLPPHSQQILQKKGVFEYDATGNLVTTLVDNKECAFVFFENNIAKCAIEKAFFSQKITFPKPISCHLYPIRIIDHQYYFALNYDKWKVCKGAEERGKELKMSVFIFLQEPLKRRFGATWLEEVKNFLAHQTTF